MKTPPPDDYALSDLAVKLAALLIAGRGTLAVAESCTGGWIAKLLTDLPGSSAWFATGLVTYSNASKQRLLGVTEETLLNHGAVSRECALEMVSGARECLDVDLAVAVTGVAGPTGGSVDKPVGTVWIAWQRRGRDTQVEKFRFDGDRESVRRHSVAAALEGLIRALA